MYYLVLLRYSFLYSKTIGPVRMQIVSMFHFCTHKERVELRKFWWYHLFELVIKRVSKVCTTRCDTSNKSINFNQVSTDIWIRNTSLSNYRATNHRDRLLTRKQPIPNPYKLTRSVIKRILISICLVSFWTGKKKGTSLIAQTDLFFFTSSFYRTYISFNHEAFYFFDWIVYAIKKKYMSN